MAQAGRVTFASPSSPFGASLRRAPLLSLLGVSTALGPHAGGLAGLSLTLPARGLTAVAGESEVAKALLFALLQRRREPSAGAVLLDGRDLFSLPHDEVTRAVATVERDGPVRSGTLRDNLRGAAPQASAGELVAVVAEARLELLLERLPDGLDSEIADGATPLREGERQRIAIARALLRRPRLLLVDETTAPLDGSDAEALRATLARAATRCAVLVLASRPSTARAADRVVLLDEGRVRASGTHDALLVQEPRYRELVATGLAAQRAG